MEKSYEIFLENKNKTVLSLKSRDINGIKLLLEKYPKHIVIRNNKIMRNTTNGK